VFFAAACIGWSLVITGNRLLEAAEARAKDWEQRAGEAARDTLAASLYSRVALPVPTAVPVLKLQDFVRFTADLRDAGRRARG
jgi:hypothetical protein